MTTELKILFEQEKEKLKETYCPPKSFWNFFRRTTYQSTLDIANTPPYITDQFEEFKPYYTKYTSLIFIPLLAWFGYQAFDVYKMHNEIFEKIGVFFVLLFISALVGFIQFARLNLDRKPTLIIDRKGMFIRENKLTIEWQNIVDTYIKTRSQRHSDSTSLLVHYYDEISSTFKKIETSLNNISQKSDKISYAIELMKSKCN